jgi:cell division protein FtsB
MKRGQLSLSHIVVYMAVALVAILIFYFGYRAVFGVTQAEEKSKIELLKVQQKADVSRISSQQKVTASYAYQLPSDYSEFCFVDLTRKDKIDSESLRADYPVIYNSIKSNTDYNAFLIGKDTIAYNVGSVRINCPPYFACYNKTGTRLLYRLKGMMVYAMPDICPEFANKLPYFTETMPGEHITLQSGSLQYFSAKAIDPEGSNLSIKWTVRYMSNTETTVKTEPSIANGSVITYTQNTFPNTGTYYVVVQATDNQSMSGYYTFTVSTMGVIPLAFRCYFTDNCAPQNTLVSLSANTNAHASLIDLPDYPAKVCCMAEGATISMLPCDNPLFYLSGGTNAHASLTPTAIFGTPVCFSSSAEEISCGECTDPDKCTLKLSDTTNAHISDCSSDYPISICCGIT